MSFVIRVSGMRGQTIAPSPAEADGWVKSFDPEAYEGRGIAELTSDVAEAKRFSSMEEAYAFWRLVPEARPIRDDGRPNRPLTAFSVSIEAAP
jgi:hypothetical protein